MMTAKTGDDVFGEDPTVNLLEKTVSDIFGMEAGLFCPSGTMTNQIAIKCHTSPGNEVICETESHVYIYEGGGIAFNSGCQVKPVNGDRGRLNAAQIEHCINPDDVHKARTTLVCLENSCNRGGGSVYEMDQLTAIRKLCDERKLRLHLDGARIFNALVATGQQPKEYGQVFHSISVCLSKGLGCPVGSVLLGDFEFIREARRIRKVLGGGMRQAGYLAAAGLYALENNVERLANDHVHAKEIARALLDKEFVGHMLPVETNIIIFEVLERFDAASFCALMAEYNIHCLPISKNYVRMVLHLDISEAMVAHVTEVLSPL